MTAPLPIQGTGANASVEQAGHLIDSTLKFVQTLQNAAAGLVVPVITPYFPGIATPPKPIDIPFPTLKTVTWDTPTQPTAFNGTLDIARFLPKDFTGIAPQLNFGTAPAPFNGHIPDAPAIDLNFVYPKVDIKLPTAPSLLTLDTIVFGDVVIPDFNPLVPLLLAVAPSVIVYQEGAQYTSALLDTVKKSIQDAMLNGLDTGLPASIENNLWDREREREYRQMADGLADLERMEAMGFAFPPGVYLDARIKAQTEMQNTSAMASREIAFKQADLHLTNITKARDQAVMLESKLIDYINQIAQRTFEATKYATEAKIQIYNAQVQAYTASLEGYKAQAAVYQARIQGILAQVEIIKERVAVERLKVDINTALIQQYEAQIRASLATLEIYKGEIEIIKVQGEIEKLKIDVYGAEIQAFTGTVNAYTAQVEGYKAQVQTQGVIESVYKTQVEAYSAQVDAQIKGADAVIAQYKGQIEAYTAQLDAYKAAIAAMSAQVQATAQYNTAEADVFRAEVQAIASYNDVLTKQWQAIIDEHERIAEVGIKAAEANGQLVISARSLVVEAAKVGAQVHAQLGAAALNATHYSYNNSFNANISDSETNAKTDNTSHNYNASV